MCRGSFFFANRMGMAWGLFRLRVGWDISPCGAGRGLEMFRPRASDFLCGQKVTKEPSRGRGISISPFP